MEKEKVLNQPEKTPDSSEERLKTLAEKSGKSIDELLSSLEEKQTIIEQNNSAKERSTGSQNSENSFSVDPSGSEFLKGIWGR